MLRIYSLITGVICLFFSSLIHSQTYGSLHAVDDEVTAGPMQSVRINVIANDTMPCVDSYSWRVTATLDPIAQGTVEKQGNYLVFHPGPACRDKTVHIPYAMKCGSSYTESAATAVVAVTNYNRPVNVLPKDVACWDVFPGNVGFDVENKFHSDKVDGKHSNSLLVYSLPLVGDLNGDHKPEILALGLQSYGGRTSAIARYIVIMDGQTGKTLVEYDVRCEFAVSGDLPSGSAYHSSPSYMAIADVDDDGKGEIILAFPVAKSGAVNPYGERVVAFKIVTNDAKEITGLQPYWTAPVGYKEPLTGTDHLVYDVPAPYIADLNGDGIPEVIVYNKIYNAQTGRLLMAWDGPAASPRNSRLASGTGLFPCENSGIYTAEATSNTVNDRAFTGRRPSTSTSNRKDDYLAVFAVEDMDDDEDLEVVAGNRVYKFRFHYLGKDDEAGSHEDNTYTTVEGPRSVTLPTTGSNTVTYYLSDGFTRVADIDGDGHLDVINISEVATSGTSGSRATGLITVWDPRSPGVIKAASAFFGSGGDQLHIPTFGIPFVGDINGKTDGGWDGTKFTEKLPEIGLITSALFINGSNSAPKRNGITFHPLSDENLRQGVGWDNQNTTAGGRRFNRTSISNGGHIFAVTYCDSAGVVPFHRRLKLSWAMEHADRSSDTGLTIFDFNNDGAKDLVYRDESHLRVISPKYSGKDYVTVSETAGAGTSIMFRTAVSSLTGYEAPTIADVNMDASADIVVTRSNDGNFGGGRIEVYQYKSGTSKWAPAPPVWNQAYYNPRHIGEDLRVPSRPTPALTKYEAGAGDSIQPYNGAWEQIHYVRDDAAYDPVVRRPDAALIDMAVTANSAATTTVVVTICNFGSASIPAGTPITFYDGGPNPGNNLEQSAQIGAQQQVVGVDIFPNETILRTFTLSSFDGRDKLIWARITDDRGTFPAVGFTDCDLANNTASGAYCPQMNYSIAPAGDGEICAGGDLTLTATPASTPPYPPTCQWFHNSAMIAGATGQTYLASAPGDYTCYVTEGICRQYTPDKKVVVRSVEAFSDNAVVFREMPACIRVLANDVIPPQCTPVLKIEKNPLYGTAIASGSHILYTPDNGYTGPDEFVYSLSNGADAAVYVNVVEAPGAIVSSACATGAPGISWTMREIPVNLRDTIDNSAPLTVGDIDGDGRPEVLAYQPYLPGGDIHKRPGMKIFCYDRAEGGMTLKCAFDFRDRNANAFPSSAAGAPAIARYDGGGYIVVLNSDDFHLYAFDENGDCRWKSGVAATDSVPATMVGIADFNADGIPEVYTGNRIFSLVNGNLLCEGDGSDGGSNKGALPAGGGYSSMAVDIDGDGVPELCAGTQVFKATIPAGSTSAGAGSMSVFRELDVAKLPAGAGRDGATQAADIDGDGQMEIVVVSHQAGQLAACVWKPLSGDRSYLIGSYAVAGNGTNYGIPLIGNIDADPYPEIVFVANLHPDEIHALEYDPGAALGSQIGAKWSLKESLQSGGMGMSLFDFNQDGIAEILCRNESALRIIDGSGVLPAELTAANNVSSRTLREMPVVADIDDDGQAEIIVSGGRGVDAGQGAADEQYNGYLRVFASADAAWAPARKVWNQYAYNAVNINDDLTVPEYRVSPATLFPGNDETFGTGDDTRPCNAFLQQQTVLNQYGEPLWPAPYGEIVLPSTTFYDASNDSLVIHLVVVNIGDAAYHPPLYVTAYKDDDIVGAAIATDSILSPVNTGDTIAFSMSIANFSNHLPVKEIVVRLNDRGDVSEVQRECNRLSLKEALRSSILLAITDHIFVFMNMPRELDLLANDSLLTQCGNHTLEIVRHPRHGMVSVGSDGNLYYKPSANFLGRDSMFYEVSCGGNTSAATVYLSVKNKPAYMGDADCRLAVSPGSIGKLALKAVSSHQVFWLANPFVGDIDRDGRPEVVVPGIANILPSPTNTTSRIFIFDDSLKLKRAIETGPMPEEYTMTFLVADTDNDGYGEIVVCLNNQRVRCYTYDGAIKWTSNESYGGNSNVCPSPIVADIDGDGTSEILVADLLLAGESGKTLAKLPGGGRGYSVGGPPSYMSVFADMDNDGIMEIAAGSSVYKVTIASRTDPGKNKIWSIASSGGTDGFTAVADVDRDGDPDVIVMGGTVSDNIALMYVWDGAKPVRIGNSIQVASTKKFIARPAVGDIDGSGYPAIVFCYVNMLEAYRYNPATKIFSRLWQKKINEPSGTTSVAMFDFDMDGSMEIVHRDSKYLRIINRTGITVDSISCASLTGTEGPVIVDLNRDGHANILVSGVPAGYPSGDVRIVCYGSNTSGRWAPARSVWNQHAYTSLHINDNLSIPRAPLSPATVFSGNLRPYNNFLQQQTTRTFGGVAYWPAPDLTPVEKGSKIEVLPGKIISTTVAIRNQGEGTIMPPIPVTFYRESLSAANKILTATVTRPIYPGDTGFVVGTVHSDTPIMKVIARVNDSGSAFPSVPECRDNNNEFFLINSNYSQYMKKSASVNGTPGNGAYGNPVSVLYGDSVRYGINAYNVSRNAGTVAIRDTLPVYLEYVSGTASPSASGVFLHTTTNGTPKQDILSWTLNNVAAMDDTTVTYEARPVPGVCASQPLFINRAWVTSNATTFETDSSTYHQGAGASVVSFSAGHGGAVYNARPQVLDYRTTPRSGILVVPDEGYAFAGWRHGDYYSLRDEPVRAKSHIMHYDTLVIFGNVELTADFELIEYPVRYYLNGGDAAGANPETYTVVSGVIALEAPHKAGDIFTGWTGSNGETPQKTAVIPEGSTGELEFYANYLYSGCEDRAIPPATDRIWGAKGELYIRTSKTGSIARIYSADGKLTGQHTILSASITKIKLRPGVYIVALNSDVVQKILIE